MSVISVEKEDKKELYRDLEKYGSLGRELVVAVLIGVFGGHWLDQRFKTSPCLTIIGFILGAAAGFRDIYRIIKQELE